MKGRKRPLRERVASLRMCRAKGRGLTLTRYIQEILEAEVARPPADEVVERISRRPPVDLGESAADLLRRERRERGLG